MCILLGLNPRSVTGSSKACRRTPIIHTTDNRHTCKGIIKISPAQKLQQFDFIPDEQHTPSLMVWRRKGLCARVRYARVLVPPNQSIIKGPHKATHGPRRSHILTYIRTHTHTTVGKRNALALLAVCARTCACAGVAEYSQKHKKGQRACGHGALCDTTPRGRGGSGFSGRGECVRGAVSNRTTPRRSTCSRHRPAQIARQIVFTCTHK